MASYPKALPAADRNAGDARKGVQSASVSLAVLKTLIEGGRPLFLREIALGAGLPPSNVYRYLVSFVAAGMAMQDQASGKYDLGPLALQLGLSALRRIDGVEVAVHCLSELVERVRTDGHICVWGSGGPTVLRWKGASDYISIKVNEGRVLPLAASATGKVWLSYLHPSRLAAVGLESAKGKFVGECWTPRDAPLKAALDEVRKVGIAVSRGEQRPGIDAISVPVFDQDGAIIMSLTALGVSGRIDTSLTGTLADSLCATAINISRQIGAGPLALARYPFHTSRKP